MKQAVVALIIKDGLILSISRRHDKTIFGLPGGKVEDGETLEQALFREVQEETGVQVNRCIQVYQRVELGDGANAVDFYSSTYYVIDWSGEPCNSEEGEVKWLTAEELTSTKAAFGDYNRKMLNSFKETFPEVYIQGESEIQAWHIVEILTDGSKKHLGTIRTPDAELRAKARAEKIKSEEGKNVFAEKFDGPFMHHMDKGKK
jgi:mutator protein MutT